MLVVANHSITRRIAAGYFQESIAESKLGAAEEEARKLLDEAIKQAETKRKEVLVEAKDEVYRIRQEAERDNRERRRELDRMERRLIQKEESLDKKLDNIEQKDQVIREKETMVEKTQEDLKLILTQQLKEMERISGMSSEQARELLLHNVEQQIRAEAAALIREIEAEAKEEADKRARR